MTAQHVYGSRATKRRRADAAEMAERREMVTAILRDHHPCSVRHAYYQAVVRGVPGIDKSQKGYRKVQRVVLDLRRRGAIPYRWVVDNSRTVFQVEQWDGQDEFLADMAGAYRRDLWRRSPYRVEVWAESDSIAGVLMRLTQGWRVPLFPLRGQSSETFAYEAAQGWLDTPWRQPVVLYVGDHDPAGLEIEDALRAKLTRFADGLQYPPVFRRLAVTWDQVERYDLPGSKPKKGYGHPLAVESEALDPVILRELVDAAIAEHVDQDELERLVAVEEQERLGLQQLAEYFGGMDDALPDWLGGGRDG